MFAHNKRLQYTVRVAGPNPGLANLMLEQFGGPQGELAAAMRYFTQAVAEDDPGRKDMLYDIATEELSHLEIIGHIVAMLNKGAKGRLAEAVDSEADMYRAITGPVSRGDVGTIRTHLQVLDPELAAAYRVLAVRSAHRAAAAVPEGCGFVHPAGDVGLHRPVGDALLVDAADGDEVLDEAAVYAVRCALVVPVGQRQQDRPVSRRERGDAPRQPRPVAAPRGRGSAARNGTARPGARRQPARSRPRPAS